MGDMSAKHTFVICAYKESAYLEECILSLKQQTVKSNIIMITSTPNNNKEMEELLKTGILYLQYVELCILICLIKMMCIFQSMQSML